LIPTDCDTLFFSVFGAAGGTSYQGTQKKRPDREVLVPWRRKERGSKMENFFFTFSFLRLSNLFVLFQSGSLCVSGSLPSIHPSIHPSIYPCWLLFPSNVASFMPRARIEAVICPFARRSLSQLETNMGGYKGFIYYLYAPLDVNGLSSLVIISMSDNASARASLDL
jgi:hypothetical protein